MKYQVIEMNGAGKHDLLAKGLVERIGIENSIITHKPTGKDKVETVTDIPDHTVGIDLIIKAITNPSHGVISSLDEISAVGHRVAHGGEYFKESALVNDHVMELIGSCVDLAPLHNPANMKGIYRNCCQPFRRWPRSTPLSIRPCRAGPTSMPYPTNITSSTAFAVTVSTARATSSWHRRAAK